MKRWWDDTTGRLLLHLAAVLHRTVASDKANSRWLSRRDRAIRAARRKGVPVEVLAAPLRLSPGWVRQVLAGRNVIVLRTFSKAQGLAGIRLGYGIANPELIQYFVRVKVVFSVSAIAEAAGLAAMRDGAHIQSLPSA